MLFISHKSVTDGETKDQRFEFFLSYISICEAEVGRFDERILT